MIKMQLMLKKEKKPLKESRNTNSSGCRHIYGGERNKTFGSLYQKQEEKK